MGSKEDYGNLNPIKMTDNGTAARAVTDGLDLLAGSTSEVDLGVTEELPLKPQWSTSREAVAAFLMMRKKTSRMQGSFAQLSEGLTAIRTTLADRKVLQ